MPIVSGLKLTKNWGKLFFCKTLHKMQAVPQLQLDSFVKFLRVAVQTPSFEECSWNFRRYRLLIKAIVRRCCKSLKAIDKSSQVPDYQPVFLSGNSKWFQLLLEEIRFSFQGMALSFALKYAFHD